MRAVSFTSPYDAEALQAQRQQQYAEQLMQQSQEPLQGRMVGRQYVAPHFMEGIAKMAQALSGRHAREYADKQLLDVTNRRAQDYARALQGVKDGNYESLLSNPDTAAIGAQAMFDDRRADRQAQLEADAATTAHQRALERDAAKAGQKPPETRTVRMGSEDVTQQYDPATKQWTEIGRGAAWNPNPGMVVQNYPAPTPVIGPDGKPMMVQFGNKGDVVETPYQPIPKNTMSSKETATANAKIQAAQNLKRQIAAAREAFSAIQGTFAAGPITGLNPFSEKGQQFDAAIDALRSTVTALTRTPGVGAMSDFETRLDQSKIPSRGKYESVTAQQLDELEDLADGVIGGYSDLLGTPQDVPAASSATTGGLSAEEQAELEALRRELQQ